MLTLERVVTRYGRIRALEDVTLAVGAGEFVCLIGANGAGKTTTLKTISGLLRPAEGRIVFEGAEIQGRPPQEILRRGIAHCPEGRRVFPYMSVTENLEMGAYVRGDAPAVAADLDRVFSHFPVLGERRRQSAGTLSGGEQQMLAIGRALMARPRLILFDEPSLGLAPTVVDSVFETLARVRDRGVTVLLVEQRAQRTVALADRTYVLANGELRATLEPADAADTDRLIAAYLA